MIRVVTAPYVLTGAFDPFRRSIPNGAVALDGDRIVDVGFRRKIEKRYGSAEELDAVILPALVNAHVHLELSHLRGRVPGGGGLASWLTRLVAERARTTRLDSDGAIGGALAGLSAAGVAAVGEVTNSLAAAVPLARAGFSGTVFHEILGFSPERIEVALVEAASVQERLAVNAPGLSVVQSPHAVYSTHPFAVSVLLLGALASIHLAEDPAERTFCALGGGPLAEIARRLGATYLEPLGRSAVAAVARCLGDRSLVVHAVDLDGDDVAALSSSGATVALCPRSNLHIVGKLADLPRLLAARVPLAVGTDSLASSPSLSPLAEIATLRRAYPKVPPSVLLHMAWNGAAVGAPAVGRFAPGSSPGVLAAPLHGERPIDAAAWMIDVFGTEERPFVWVARHRPETNT